MNVYGINGALPLERDVQSAVDLAWEALADTYDMIEVEEWEEGVPDQSPATLVALWNVPIDPGSEAPPLADPSQRMEFIYTG